jgi:hypothetical protein
MNNKIPKKYFVDQMMKRRDLEFLSIKRLPLQLFEKRKILKY